MTDAIDVAYDAFTDQVDIKLESGGPSDELKTAIDDLIAARAANPEAELHYGAVMTAIRGMNRTACGKAKLLWTGALVGTILRNKKLGQNATRAISAAGIPLWIISTDAGEKWESHEPVLEPKLDWSCKYDPRDDEDEE